MPKLIAQLIAAQEQEELDAPSSVEEIDPDDLGGGSLNAGAELDHEDSLGEEAPVCEAPDTQEVVNELVALENCLQDLGYLKSSIHQAGGMNQEFALEAQKLVPGFDSVPVGYYSAHTSLTRYKVTLEALSVGAWNLIIAAIGALVVLIIKVISWFSGTKNAKGGSAGSHQAAQEFQQHKERADIFPKSLDKVDSLVDQADGLLSRANLTLINDEGEEKRCTSLQQAIDHLFTDVERFGRVKRFLKGGDPIFSDIATNGPYSHAVSGAAERLGYVTAVLTARVTLLDSMVRTDLNSTNNDSVWVKSTLGRAADPTLIVFNGTERVTLSEAAQAIAQERSKVMAFDEAKPLVFDEMYRALGKSYRAADLTRMSKHMTDAFHSLGELEKRVERLQNIARDLASDGHTGAVSQDVGPLLRQVIQAVAQDVAGFGSLAHQLKSYVVSLEFFTKETIGFSKEIIRKLVTQMHRQGLEVPPAWDDIVRDLEVELKTIKRAYRSF